MQREIEEAISSIRHSIALLENNAPEERHARACVAQALRDLDQAAVFLEDIDHPAERLERCAGFEEKYLERW